MTAFEVLVGKAAPAPVIFPLVEVVFSIGAIAIQFVDQHAVFVDHDVIAQFRKTQLQLTLRILTDNDQVFLDLAFQHHNTLSAAPTSQSQRRLRHLAILLSGINPVTNQHQAFDQSLGDFVKRCLNKNGTLILSAVFSRISQ